MRRIHMQMIHLGSVSNGNQGNRRNRIGKQKPCKDGISGKVPQMVASAQSCRKFRNVSYVPEFVLIQGKVAGCWYWLETSHWLNLPLVHVNSKAFLNAQAKRFQYSKVGCQREPQVWLTETKANRSQGKDAQRVRGYERFSAEQAECHQVCCHHRIWYSYVRLMLQKFTENIISIARLSLGTSM